MLIKVKDLFFYKKVNSEYKHEFEINRINVNLERCKEIAVILLILNTILFIIDIKWYKPMRSSTLSYLYLYYSHIIIFILLLLWIVISKFLKNSNKASVRKFLYHTFLNIVIYWCVFMGLNSLKISGQIYAYIICVLSFAISIYLSPLEGLVIYMLSFIIFCIGLVYMVNNPRILYCSIINSAIVILCSYVASNMNYSSFAKDFINNKIILKGKDELEINHLRLKEYEKLRTDFFANISHELRTPLNVIYSAEQMLEINLGNKEYDILKMHKYIKMIKQNSFRLIRLINNLIDITKIDATSFEIKPINCDIISVVENVTMSVADYIGTKGITIIFDTEIEEKIIACDPDKIERIMLNLLSNATKFTDNNGYIYVNIFLEEDAVGISVKDTGIGIEEKMHEFIFERFIQEDKSISRNKEGSGIGLSLVKSLVEMHNGRIVLKSQSGKGSEFVIYLPDKTINKEYEGEYLKRLSDQRIEKINIEFSDIYR